MTVCVMTGNRDASHNNTKKSLSVFVKGTKKGCHTRDLVITELYVKWKLQCIQQSTVVTGYSWAQDDKP